MRIDKPSAAYWRADETISTRTSRSVTDLEVICLFSALGLVISAVVLILGGSHIMFDALSLVAY